MELTNLINLHKEMLKINEIIDFFDYNDRRFDIIFFTDDTPFHLLIGVLGTRGSFIIDVKYGYGINTKLSKEEYSKLCYILGIDYDENKKFYPSNFFKNLIDKIRTIYSK